MRRRNTMKQKCRRWLAVAIMLLAVPLAFAPSSWSLELATAERSREVEMLKHRLKRVQMEIVRQFHAPEMMSERQAVSSLAVADAQQRRLPIRSRLEQEKAFLEREIQRLQHQSGASAEQTAMLSASSGQISGKVTDSSGNGIAGVSVAAYPKDSLAGAGYATTDSLGNYAAAVNAGTYQVKFSGTAAFAGEWYNDAPMQNCAEPVTVTDGGIAGNINATLARGGSISGKVTDESGNAIAGIDVYAYDANYSYSWYSSTRADGTYVIGALPTGNYKVSFLNYYGSSGFIREWYNDKADFNSADPVAVTAPNTTANINATLARGGGISGKVTDESGNGIADISVYVYAANSSYSAYYSSTRADGTYVIGALPTGNYRVAFYPGSTASGFVGEWYNDKADSSSADPVAVTAPNITANINATLVRGGGISGKVTDESGNAIAGVYLAVYAANYSYSMYSYTRSDGTYELGGLPTENYKVAFYAGFTDLGFVGEWYNDKADFNSADLVAVTAPNTTANINAILAKGGGISGKVTDESGNAIAGVSVYTYDSNYNYIRYSSTGTDGTYTVSSLLSGGYKIQFYKNSSVTEWYNDKADFSSADVVAVTAPNTTTGINAALSNGGSGGSISGTVTKNGAACKCAQVSATYNGSYSYSTYADYQGKYSISGLSPAAYKVYFYDPDGKAAQWHDRKAGFSCADPISVTAAGVVSGIDAAFPVQLQQCGGAVLTPIINLLLN